MISVLCVFLLNNLISVATVEKGKSVNLNLETVVEFDNKNLDSDVKIIDNVQKFLSKVRNVLDKNKNFRRSSSKDYAKFTSFVQNVISLLITYSNDELEELINVVDEELRKYHYKGCKFYELVQNNKFRRFISESLDEMKRTHPRKIKKSLRRFLRKLETRDFNEKDLEFVDYINSLYTVTAKEKIYNVSKSFEDFSKSKQRSHADLIKVVRDGIKTVIFDHYSSLNSNARKDLRIKISSYFGEHTPVDIKGDVTVIPNTTFIQTEVEKITTRKTSKQTTEVENIFNPFADSVDETKKRKPIKEKAESKDWVNDFIKTDHETTTKKLSKVTSTRKQSFDRSSDTDDETSISTRKPTKRNTEGDGQLNNDETTALKPTPTKGLYQRFREKNLREEVTVDLPYPVRDLEAEQKKMPLRFISLFTEEIRTTSPKPKHRKKKKRSKYRTRGKQESEISNYWQPMRHKKHRERIIRINQPKTIMLVREDRPLREILTEHNAVIRVANSKFTPDPSMRGVKEHRKRKASRDVKNRPQLNMRFRNRALQSDSQEKSTREINSRKEVQHNLENGIAIESFEDNVLEGHYKYRKQNRKDNFKRSAKRKMDKMKRNSFRHETNSEAEEIKKIYRENIRKSNNGDFESISLVDQLKEHNNQMKKHKHRKTELKKGKHNTANHQNKTIYKARSDNNENKVRSNISQNYILNKIYTLERQLADVRHQLVSHSDISNRSTAATIKLINTTSTSTSMTSTMSTTEINPPIVIVNSTEISKNNFTSQKFPTLPYWVGTPKTTRVLYISSSSSSGESSDDDNVPIPKAQISKKVNMTKPVIAAKDNDRLNTTSSISLIDHPKKTPLNAEQVETIIFNITGGAEIEDDHTPYYRSQIDTMKSKKIDNFKVLPPTGFSYVKKDSENESNVTVTDGIKAKSAKTKVKSGTGKVELNTTEDARQEFWATIVNKNNTFLSTEEEWLKDNQTETEMVKTSVQLPVKSTTSAATSTELNKSETLARNSELLNTTIEINATKEGDIQKDKIKTENVTMSNQTTITEAPEETFRLDFTFSEDMNVGTVTSNNDIKTEPSAKRRRNLAYYGPKEVKNPFHMNLKDFDKDREMDATFYNWA